MLSNEEIKAYFHTLLKSCKYAARTINLHIGALRTFYNFVSKSSDIMNGIPYVKEPKTLPVILTKEQILAMLACTQNIKHKAVIATFYSTGIRLSECQALTIKDIDSTQMLVRVKYGKGKKERFTILSEYNLQLLRIYLKAYHPRKWLFETARGQMNLRTIQKIISNAGEKAKIPFHVTTHMLRHSFATHMLEQGVNLQIIQKLLGHSSIKTTTIYTQVSTQLIQKMISPLDTIAIEEASYV